MRETGEDMNWWQMETKEAARRLETDEKQGLTSQMAAERLAQKGRNELAETDGKKSLFWRFLAQFDDFMILLLLGAAVVSVVISRLSGENDVLDAVMILGIVVLNAALGLFQESKAEKALEALKKWRRLMLVSFEMVWCVKFRRQKWCWGICCCWKQGTLSVLTGVWWKAAV